MSDYISRPKTNSGQQKKPTSATTERSITLGSFTTVPTESTAALSDARMQIGEATKRLVRPSQRVVVRRYALK